MATAKLNGVELYYETVGAGPRLVLTHGSWTDGSGWAPVVALLAERYEVVTWDRRGHSRSGPGAGPGSRAEDAADLAATTVPLQFTSGSESPSFFSAVIGELALLVPSAKVATVAGAGHIPHATHPDQWVAAVLAFHDTIATSARGAQR